MGNKFWNRRQTLRATGAATIGLAGVSLAKPVAGVDQLKIEWRNPSQNIGSGGSSVENEVFAVTPNITIEGETTIEPGADIAVEITNVDTDSSAVVSLEPGEEVPLGSRLQLSGIVDRAGEFFDEDPYIRIVGMEDDPIEVPVSITSETNIFSERRAAEYTASLLDGETEIDTADPKRLIFGYTPSPEARTDDDQLEVTFQRDGMPDDLDVILQLFSGGFGSEPEREIVGTFKEETIIFTDSAPDFDLENHAIIIKQNDRELMGSNSGIFTFDIEKVENIEEPGVDTTLTVDNVASSAWELTDIEGDNATAPTDEENPSITVEEGVRYRIKNDGLDAHPIAFERADGTVLLSQDGEGSYEADASVEWVDDGDTVEFTLTDSLASELSTYVCTVHDSMAGSIGVDPTGGPDDINFDEKGFSEEQFNAVFDTDGEQTQTDLSNSINEWFMSDDNTVDGVEIDQTELSELINHWFTEIQA